MTGSPRLTTTAPCTPTLQRTFPIQALGWGGWSPAWRLEVGQSRHEVKRQRSNKRLASPPGGDEKSPHHRNLPHGHPQESRLAALRCHVRARAGSCSHGHVRACGELFTRPRARARSCSQGRALRLLLRVSLLSHRVSPHVLQGPEAQRRPQLHVDGGHVEVDQICKAAGVGLRGGGLGCHGSAGAS